MEKRQEQDSLALRIKKHPFTIGLFLLLPLLCYWGLYWMWKFKVWTLSRRLAISAVHALLALLFFSALQQNKSTKAAELAPEAAASAARYERLRRAAQTQRVDRFLEEVPSKLTSGSRRADIAQELEKLLVGIENNATKVKADQLLASLKSEVEVEAAAAEMNTICKDGQVLMQKREWLEAREMLETCSTKTQLVLDADVSKGLVSPKNKQLAKQLNARAKARLRSIRPRVEYLERCGPQPKLTMWNAERLLRRSAHDPDSIRVTECSSPTLHHSQCWVSTCKFRGKNAFGAKVLNQVKVSENSEVVKVLR